MADLQTPQGPGFKGDDEAKVTVVVVPIPAQGHLNQFLHLSRIITSHHIPVHFVSTLSHNRQAKLRAHGWDPLNNSHLHFHDLTMPSFDAPPPEPNAHVKQFTSLFHSMIHFREPIYDLLRELAKTSRRVVVIIDYFLLWVVQDVSSIPNAESYCFHSISSFSLFYADCTIAGKPVLVHGEPLRDLPPEVNVLPEHLLEYIKLMSKSINGNHGNLYNSCRVIEGQFLDLLAEEKLTNTDKHWAIGPLNLVSISSETERKASNKYLEWLDKQHPKSVIFVSFGSITSLSEEQINEIALGLEGSGESFMWVLRDADRADIFEGESRGFQLPDGFEERVEGRGIIIRDWAPQLEILGHPSTGGFMSHCGWNSCVESISKGVPIAAWPMHSEQPANAILIAQVLKIGVIVKEWSPENEVVRSVTIEEAVKRLMVSAEGDEIRQRAAELCTAVKQSVMEDGATTAEIASFISHISR